MTNDELKSEVLELCVEIRDTALLQASMEAVDTDPSPEIEELKRLFSQVEALFEEKV